jgi:hypothetical protein
MAIEDDQQAVADVVEIAHTYRDEKIECRDSIRPAASFNLRY